MIDCGHAIAFVLYTQTNFVYTYIATANPKETN